jgi:pimeloyl-ACP methyl ester carboxylesterase
MTTTSASANSMQVAEPTRTTVTSSDGVTLAVHACTEIDHQRPTVLAVHGYPDNHHVWDGVAAHLIERDTVRHNGKYSFVAYDVRGAGESAAPARRSGYRFDQLMSDLNAVIDSLGVDQVHLLAHDWGSIQGWAAVTNNTVMTKVGSFTSISGPHLNYAGRFLRSARTPRGVFDVARQLMASGYIWFFLCPGLPEVVFRSGVGVKVVEAFERIGRSSTRTQNLAVARSTADYVNGLNLYRANMPTPFLAPGAQLPQTAVPVQVLVPRKDIFVTPALQPFTGSIPVGGRVVPIEGGHWVVASRPDVIARLTSEWIDRVVGGAASPSEHVVRTGRREVRGKLALITWGWRWDRAGHRYRAGPTRGRQGRHRRPRYCGGRRYRLRRPGRRCRGLPGRRQRRSGDE